MARFYGQLTGLSGSKRKNGALFPVGGRIYVYTGLIPLSAYIRMDKTFEIDRRCTAEHGRRDPPRKHDYADKCHYFLKK